MIRRSVFFWLGLAAVAGGFLFHTSYQVQELEEQLGSLNRSIIQEQEHIQVLNADWGYMNDPSRLERLAAQHLQLQATAVGQLASLTTLPLRAPAPPEPQLPPVVYAAVPTNAMVPLSALRAPEPAAVPATARQPAAQPAAPVVVPATAVVATDVARLPASAVSVPAQPAAPVVLAAVAARPVAVPSRPTSDTRPDRPRKPAVPLPIRSNRRSGDEIGLLLARIGVN